MCYKVVSKEPFMLKYCLNRYNAQEMCVKAVDIVFVSYDTDNVTFFSDDIWVLIHMIYGVVTQN